MIDPKTDVYKLKTLLKEVVWDYNISEDELLEIFLQGKKGQALMLKHRYSDDLDFFLNNDKEFTTEAERAVRGLEGLFKPGINVTYKSSSFYRIIINLQNISLKLDFVNDVGFHSGEFLDNNNYHKIDNEKNILSNKVTNLAPFNVMPQKM